MYCTRTATVTVTYADTLTEGGRGDPCTWTVHVHPLCQSYYGCSNGTVTKHGSTGHPSAELGEQHFFRHESVGMIDQYLLFLQ